MFKLLIYILIIINVNNNSILKVESCSSKSNCQKYFYKNFEPRHDVMSELPDNRLIGHLALVGTHQSMSYSSKNPKIKTQKLSVTDQLRHGVRLLHISVRLQDGKFKIYTDEIELNKTLVDFLQEIERFLIFHPKELVMVIINYNYGWNLSIDFHETDPCREMEDYDRVIAGWRFAKSWTLTETIGKYRGRILLSTNDYFFKRCMNWLNDKCVNSNNIRTNNSYNTGDKVNLKWSQYLKLTENCTEYSSYSCFFYNMGLKSYNNYRISDLAKFGYYDYSDSEFHEPLNYRVIKTARTNCVLAFNIFIFDFVTPELIDYINQLNNLSIHDDFDVY